MNETYGPYARKALRHALKFGYDIELRPLSLRSKETEDEGDGKYLSLSYASKNPTIEIEAYFFPAETGSRIGGRLFFYRLVIDGQPVTLLPDQASVEFSGEDAGGTPSLATPMAVAVVIRKKEAETA